MDKRVDIHKAGAVILQDRRLLIERSIGKTIFNTPGGKLDPGETPKQALVRELLEELQIVVREEDLEEFGTFHAQASTKQDKTLRMDVFKVLKWQGDIAADHEVEELKWVNSSEAAELEIGSVFQQEIVPRVKAQGLID